jgi:hypothetical protein
MLRYLIAVLGLYMVVSACVGPAQDRLIITGKTISVPQSNTFCDENKESQLCSK